MTKIIKNIMILLGVFFMISGLGYAEGNYLTVTHELGKAIVPQEIETVVVFDYATLDTLNAMGVEIAGLPQVSIPDYLSNFKSDQYVDTGTLFEPNFERIYELDPDVIFISGRQADLYDQFARIAPTVYLAIDPSDFTESFIKNQRLLAEIFNQTEFVEKELAVITGRIAKLAEQAQSNGDNALLIMANDGALSAYGPGSRFGFIHNDFQFPAADDGIQVANHGQNISFEFLLRVNPDYLFVIDRAASVGGSIAAEQVLDNPLVRMIDAYKNDRIIYLNSQVWYVATGGLTATKLMIDDLESAF